LLNLKSIFMKIKKLFTILTVLCFSALAGVVFLKFVDNKKNARDIALANVESLANAEGDGIGNEDNPSTTIKKCVSSSEFTKDDSTGEYYLVCNSGTTESVIYRCPSGTTEGHKDWIYSFLYCTR
ncbi:NVEALA domain-containing protein, partial [Bacteroides fragilis]|jgi:hypothetical protein